MAFMQPAFGCNCGSFTAQIFQQEISGHQENLEIKFYLKRSNDITISSISYYLPDSFSVDSITLDTGLHTGADSSVYWLYLKKNSYNKNHLLKEFKIYITTENEVKRVTGYFYWTPWNTTKIYSLSNIPKRDIIWMADDPTINELVSFPIDSLPATPDTTLPIIYKRIAGLPYMFPVNDTTDTTASFSNKKGPNDFEGTIEGRLVFPMLNEEGENILLPIANILMELRIGLYKKRFTSDGNGYFSVDYDYHAWPGELSINIEIRAYSQDEAWEDSNGHPGEKVIVSDDLSLNFFQNRKNSAIHKSEVVQITA